ncbi:MAG: hypothetical protein WCA13_11695 [Terriglobales bacterium]
MLEVRKFRLRPLICLFFLLLVAFSTLTTAEDKEEDKEKDDREKESKKENPNFAKVEGKVRCDKPESAYSIEVLDRPGHALTIAKRKCTWTEPILILGAKNQRWTGGRFRREKLDADDVLALELEGVYDPSEIVGEKK